MSANSEKSLAGSIRELCGHPDVENMDVHDISFTSTCRRDHYNLRIAKVVDDLHDLLTTLEEHVRSGAKAANALRKPRVVFVFCGMGTTWKGMCKEMLVEFPVFREKLEEIDRLLSSYVQWSLISRLEEKTHFDDPLFSPIAIFACQVGLASLWQSLGVQPQKIVGQSVGEVAAAHIAGCLTLEDAVKIIYFRSYHLSQVTGGKMLIVRNAQEGQVNEVLKMHEGKASIALFYSPTALAISGDADSVDAIKKWLQSSSRSSSKQAQLLELQVPVAFHSHHVDSCKAPLAESLQDIAPSEPTVDMISTVTGEVITDAPGIHYWVDNMRCPVLFHQAIAKSVEAKQKNVFIEIGPRSVLRAHLADIFSHEDPKCVISMSKPPEQKLFLSAVATMYELGADIEWSKLPTMGRNVTSVPHYFFNRQKSLGRSEAAVTILAGVSSLYRKHSYVFPIEGDFGMIAMISPHGQTSLYDHVVSGVIVVPGAFYVEVGFGIAAHLSTSKVKWAVGVEFEQPLVIQKDSVLRIDIDFAKDLHGEARAKAPIKLSKDGKHLATLKLTPLGADDHCMTAVMNLAHIQGRCKTRVDKDEIYSSLRRFGFQYGEAFSLITTALKSDRECLATVRVPPFLRDEMSGIVVHPSILDSLLQSSVILMSDQNDVNDLLPRSIRWFVLHRQIEDVMLIHTTLKHAGRKQTIYDVTLLTTQGIVIAELEGLVIRSITETRVGVDDMYVCDWKKVNDVPLPYSVDPKEGSNIVFVTDVVCSKAIVLPNPEERRISDFDGSKEKSDEGEKEKQEEDKKKADEHTTVNQIVVQYRRSDDIFRKLPEDVEEKLRGNQHIAAVAFLCMSPFDDSADSDTLQDEIANVCLLIRAILIRAAERGHNFPVYICTNRAWPSITSHVAHTVNPQMTALWGMTRCALREQVYPQLVTVEIQVPDAQWSLRFMQQALSVIMKEKALQDFPEVLVTTTGFYVNQLVQVESETMIPTYRKLFADADKSALVLCQDPSLASKPFAVYHENTSGGSGKELEWISIETEAFAVHHPDLFSMSVQYSQMVGSGSLKERGHPVFSLEVVGTCPQNPDEKFVCLYPVAVSTQITVPRYAAIKMSGIPNYQVGDLTKLIVIWVMQREIQSHRITLLTSSRTKHLSGMLEGLLTSRKVQKKTAVVNVVNVEEMGQDAIFQDLILSVVYLDGEVVSTISKRWEHGKYLVTCQGLMSGEAQSSLSYFLPQVEIQTINTNQVFHPQRLHSLVPALCKWMKKANEALNKITESLHNGFPSYIPPGVMVSQEMILQGSKGGSSLSLPPGFTLDMLPPEMLPPGMAEALSSSFPNGFPASMAPGMPPGMMPPGMMPPGMMPSGMMPPGMMPPGMMPPEGMPPGMGHLGGKGLEMMQNGMGPVGMMPAGMQGMPAGMPPDMMLIPGMGMPPGMTTFPGGFPSPTGSSAALSRRSYKSPLTVVKVGRKKTDQAADLNQLLAAERRDLDKLEIHASADELFRSDSVYIVVGGLTGLGWVVVQYLAEHGAGFIAIFNRRSPSFEQLNKIEQVEKRNACRVATFQADVTSLPSLEAFLRSMKEAFGGAKLKGIFYGAAVIDDSSLLNMDPVKFRKVLAPKVKGVWNFHVLTKDLQLDYFVLQSSVTSVVGNGGQTHYGAGNAFMDGIAHYRKSLGLAAQSINWGVLDLGVLQSNDIVKQTLESQGFILITTKDIASMLTPILMLDWAQVMPCKFDKEKMASRIQRDMLLYLEKRLQALLPQNLSSLRIDNQILQSVQNARNLDPDKRIEIYEKYITALACQVLSVDQSMVTPDANLIDLGMDSISAMTMISQIARETQVRLPAILFVSGDPSPLSIAQAISDAIDGKLDISDEGSGTLKIEEISEDPEDLSHSVSPFEAQQLHWYKKVPRKQNMHGTADIFLPPEIANVTSVQDAIVSVLAKHPPARFIFNERHAKSSNKFKRDILEPEQVLSLKILEDVEHISDEFQSISEEAFELEKTGPLRFIFAQKPKPLLRLVAHKASLDYGSMKTLVEDLLENLQCSRRDKTVARREVEKKHEDMDTLNTELEKMRKQVTDDVYHFWEQLRLKEFQPTSLGRDDSKVRDVFTGVGKMSMYLKPKLVTRITSFISLRTGGERISLFGVIASCWQVLLHAVTGKALVPLVFPVNIRWSVKELNHAVGSFCNEVPLVADFTVPRKSLQQFIIDNSKIIQTYIDHGVLPFSLFGDLADHIFTMLSETPHGIDIELLHAEHARQDAMTVLHPSDLETNLLIQHDIHNGLVCLTLTYKNSVLNSKKAWRMLKGLSCLVNKGLSKPSMSVAQAKTRCRKLKMESPM